MERWEDNIDESSESEEDIKRLESEDDEKWVVTRVVLYILKAFAA